MSPIRNGPDKPKSTFLYTMVKFIGVSSSATALSNYIDTLCGMKIRKALRAAMPMNITGFAPYPDFLAFCLVMVITCKFL